MALRALTTYLPPVVADNASKCATYKLQFDQGGPMRDDGTTLETSAVRREVTLSADRETVWQALASAEGLACWLADEVDIDVREGAEGTIRSRTGEVREASVEEVCERRRLVLRWCDAAGEASLVELTLEDAPAGTRVTVVEVPLARLRAAAREIQTSLLPPTAPGPTMSARTAAACVAVG